jgi:two-component system sensor histidine kinase KdpD
VVGGVWAGLIASVLSFLAMNFWFVPPLHTLAVERWQDTLALAVFLVVAAVVGVLVARSLEARDRAERQAAEIARLQAFTTLLLADLPVAALLQRAAAALAESLRLAWCSIEVDQGGEAEPLRVGWPSPGTGDDRPGAVVLPMDAQGRTLGTLTAATRAGGELTENDHRLLEAFAGQIALVLDRARTEAEVQEVRLDAEANRSRAALFSSVTHDLRTPLASIKASVTGLIESGAAMDPTQRDELQRTILEESDRLNRLVGNLLDLARMRAGALTPALEPSGVEDIVEAVVARLRPVLAPFDVRTVIRPNLPESMVDPMQIDQVLTNVLENAARFSPPGSEIRVTVAVYQGAVEVTVADRGPGIPPEERDRVFEPFVSHDRGPGRGGTGLGLAISQAIVQAHGGTIRIDGVPGGGTAVRIRLPGAPARTGDVLAPGGSARP